MLDDLLFLNYLGNICTVNLGKVKMALLRSKLCNHISIVLKCIPIELCSSVWALKISPKGIFVCGSDRIEARRVLAQVDCPEGHQTRTFRTIDLCKQTPSLNPV